jgi:hypothetical protein
MNDENSSQDYEGLSKADEEHILQLISEGKTITAIQELKAITSWPLKESKDWVDGAGIPLVVQRQLASPAVNSREVPCPYCGLSLRTPRAKQCRHCRRDWHDPENLRWLGKEN